VSLPWRQLARRDEQAMDSDCAICPLFVSVFDGFTWVEGTQEWRVEGTRKRHGRRWTDDSMDVDGEDEDADELSEESEEDEEDSEEVKALKARQRYLRSLLVSGQCVPVQVSKQRLHSSHSRKHASMPSLNIVSGYTILVLDTNVIISSLSVVDSLR